MIEDPYADLKQHRWTPELQARIEQARQAPRPSGKLHKHRQHFVKVPGQWIERLQGATGQTYRVALCLLYLHWKGRGGAVKLGNAVLKLDGVSRQSKLLALADLERRGLIVVEHRPRKSPLVHFESVSSVRHVLSHP